MPSSAARPRSVRTAKPPYAASTCSQIPCSPAEGGQLHERIDRAGARRARVRDREKRAPSACLVGRDRVGERRRLEPQVLADGQDPHLVGPEAERARGPCQRGVRLIGDVDHEVVAHRADQGLARAGERGQVRGRPAGDERPRRLGRVADPVLEPPEDLQLQLGRAGRLHPGARVDVARAGDEVSERSRPRPGRRHEREVARVAGTARVREDVAEEPLQHAPRTALLAPSAPRASLPAISPGAARCNGACESSPSQSTSASTVR